MAYRNANEMIVGLRSPLSNRTIGNALFYVVNNVANFVPGANWNGAAGGIGGVQQLNLNNPLSPRAYESNIYRIFSGPN
jgi:hypothetical protein